MICTVDPIFCAKIHFRADSCWLLFKAIYFAKMLKIPRLPCKRFKEAGSQMRELEKLLGEKEKLQAIAQSNLTKQKDIIKSENKKQKNLHSNKTEVSLLVAVLFSFIYQTKLSIVYPCFVTTTVECFCFVFSTL